MTGTSIRLRTAFHCFRLQFPVFQSNLCSVKGAVSSIVGMRPLLGEGRLWGPHMPQVLLTVPVIYLHSLILGAGM